MVEKLKCLLTGGAGFLGQNLIKQLLDSNKYEVIVFDVRQLPNSSVQCIVGDLRKISDVEAACQGIDVVFHCATAAPSGENALNKQLMHSVNVEGTQNLVSSCIKCKVKKLVYTSSASVVFDGSPLNNVKEDRPYAPKPMDYYTLTKILGEKIVLDAAKTGKLATCALRPSGIFGEGDLIFVPTVVRQAQKGKMKYIIGNGKNMMDFTYVGNVAYAHVQAADYLTLESPLNGSAYFITNQESKPFWGFMGEICEGLGYDRPGINLPFWLIIVIAAIFEYIIRPLLKPIVDLSSDFTVNRILIATTERTFDCSKAAKDFNYKPQISMDEALKRTLAAFSKLHRREYLAQSGKKSA